MKRFSIYLAIFLLLSLFSPCLTLHAAADETADYMNGISGTATNASLKPMTGLPEGDSAIVFNTTSAESAEMRYQIAGLPANGQYHLSFWYKTDAENAAFRLSYVGDGKNKPTGYKRITVYLPPANQWKQFDMVFRTTDVAYSDNWTLCTAKADGTATGGVYNGVYVTPMQIDPLENGKDIYFTVPTVKAMQSDIRNLYDDDVLAVVEDTYGNGDALYDVLGIRNASGTEKTAKFNASLASQDLYAPVPVDESDLLPPLSGNLVAENWDMEGAWENSGSWGTDQNKNWLPQGGTGNWGSALFVDTNIKYAGKQSLRLEQNSKCSFIKRDVFVDSLTTYQFIVWTRQTHSTVDSRDVLIEFEFYDADGNYLRMDETSECFTAPEGGWMQFAQTITTPPGTGRVSIHLCAKSPADKVWFDNVEFYRVSEVPYGALSTDQVFYYPSAKTGTASLQINRAAYPKFDAAAARVKFTLSGNGMESKSVEDVPFFEDTATFTFDTKDVRETLMGEDAHAYTVKAEIYSGTTVYDTISTNIYKYARPTCMDEDGNYYNDDGSLFTPVIAYHVNDIGWLDTLQAAGINTVQLGYVKTYEDNPEILETWLDELAKRNMKAIICLYADMKPAAHEDNQGSTKAVIEGLRGKEAVFAWAVQDEPASQIPNYEYFLEECYKLVRKYDDKHPVYICDTLNGYELRNSLYCDVYLASTYPHSADEPGNVTRNEATLMNSSAGTRLANVPHYHLVQAWQNGTGNYFPTMDALRNMQYSALLAGARGIGYYMIANAKEGKHLFQLPIWDEILDFHNSGEQALMYDLLANGNYPVFSESLEAAQQYKALLKNDGVYAVLLNGTNEEKAVSMPLTSYNGRATLSGGTATALYGCTPEAVQLTGDALSVSLPASGVAIVKITGVDVTAALLAEERFTDISVYQTQIEALGRMGRPSILDGYGQTAFRPNDKITRAEFAYFLINTLDLHYLSRELAYTNQFNDVNETDYYAEAVRIGRRAGIFEGDNGDFNPLSPITREEMIVMSARGMLLRYALDTAKATALDAFTDGSKVSDYAKSAVSILAGNGILQGDAESALRPLDTATRAEAAVMMAKIAGISPDYVYADLSVLSAAHLKIAEDLLATTDIADNSVWYKEKTYAPDTYILAQNLTGEVETLKIPCDDSAAAEFLCGARPENASLSDGTLSLTLDSGTTALIRLLPKTEPGLYSGNIKYGYLCAGTAEAKGFSGSLTILAFYAAHTDGVKELLAVSADSICLPEMDGVGYKVRIFSWDGNLRPTAPAYELGARR